MQFALGRREEKSDKELRRELSQKAYDPRTDPLMPRLFRKVNHTMGTIKSKTSAFTPRNNFSQELS